MQHKTGYNVYLFGERFWHRTVKGAQRRSVAAQNYCNGEHNQIIEIATGRRMKVA